MKICANCDYEGLFGRYTLAEEYGGKLGSKETKEVYICPLCSVVYTPDEFESLNDVPA